LGAGSYCTVWGTYDIERKQMFALKIYNEEDTDDALHEQEVLDKIKKFNIPNSVLYLDSFKYEYSDDTYIIQIIELCGYSLHYIIKLFVDDLVTDNKLLSEVKDSGTNNNNNNNNNKFSPGLIGSTSTSSSKTKTKKEKEKEKKQKQKLQKQQQEEQQQKQRQRASFSTDNLFSSLVNM
jgi:hypothetical protein